jgi:hypothetical protein
VDIGLQLHAGLGRALAGKRQRHPGKVQQHHPVASRRQGQAIAAGTAAGIEDAPGRGQVLAERPPGGGKLRPVPEQALPLTLDVAVVEPFYL